MIPASGAVTFAQINSELGRSAGSQVALNEIAVRMLTCDQARLSLATTIALDQLRSRSGAAFQAQMVNMGAGGVGALYTDGVNSYPLGSYLGVAPIDGAYTWADGTQTTFVIQSGYTGLRPWGMAAWTAAGALIGLCYGTPFRENGADGRSYHNWGLSGVNGIDLRPHVGATVKFVAFTIH